LKIMSQLRSICFESTIIDPLAWGTEKRTCHVRRLLAQITSEEIEEVVVILSMDKMEGVEWNDIARILERPNFSRLKRMAILGPSDDVKGMQDWISKRLPRGFIRDIVVRQRPCILATHFLNPVACRRSVQSLLTSQL
jgi:hypothetical protein